MMAPIGTNGGALNGPADREGALGALHGPQGIRERRAAVRSGVVATVVFREMRYGVEQRLLENGDIED
jgi:hypothetical protein